MDEAKVKMIYCTLLNEARLQYIGRRRWLEIIGGVKPESLPTLIEKHPVIATASLEYILSTRVITTMIRLCQTSEKESELYEVGSTITTKCNRSETKPNLSNQTFSSKNRHDH